MTAKKRIDTMTKSLNALDAVLLDIQEARKYTSLPAYAAALLRGSVKPQWADRLKTRPNTKRGARTDPNTEPRTGERDAAFLHRLATENWLETPARFELWHLAHTTALLLRSTAIDGCTLNRPLDELSNTLSALNEFSSSHYLDILAEIEAKKLIAEIYFGGAEIEMPSDIAVLTELACHFAEHVAAAQRGFAALAEATGSKPAVPRNLKLEAEHMAIHIANRRADAARVRVHDWLGERTEAERLARGHLFPDTARGT